jgi:hypothetical protein
MAVHDSDIKSYTVTPEGFDLPRALRLLLLGNGAFEDVAYGAQLEEAFREVKRLDAGKKKPKATPGPRSRAAVVVRVFIERIGLHGV